MMKSLPLKSKPVKLQKVILFVVDSNN